jgi:hypothetical protein
VQLGALDLRVAHRGEGADRGQMLRLEARPRARRPHVREGHGPARGDGEGERGAEDLPAALPVRAVERQCGRSFRALTYACTRAPSTTKATFTFT